MFFAHRQRMVWLIVKESTLAEFSVAASVLTLDTEESVRVG